MTRTYAVLEVSKAAYDEIAEKLRAAEYHQAFIAEFVDDRTSVSRVVIDMHGIALAEENR